MPSLLDTNNRIKSVDSTRKITKAMKLVATAKLRGARNSFEQGSDYAETVKKIMSLLSNSEKAKFYKEIRTEGKDLYVVISSELGLCGGYNTNMFKLIDDKTDAMFIALGKKANSFFEHRPQFNLVDSIVHITDRPSYSSVNSIGDKVFDMYNNFEIKTLNIVYTKYRNSVSFEPVIEQLFPIKEPDHKFEVDFEPTQNEIVVAALPRFVSASLLIAMKESLVSEYASRRLAMENATDNADELINTLLVQRNRARQAAITQEISEIVAGADAL